MNLLIKSAVASMVLLASSASVYAAGAGNGTVTFEGSIIEAACSISPESVDQTVSLGQVARSQLADGGTGAPEPFYIKLVGCDTSTLKTVTSTFTGAKSSEVPGALGIVGTATGAGIMMRDGTGAQVVLGTPTAAQDLQDGHNTLSYGAYLQGSSLADAVKPGEFTAVTNFSLSYQ